MRQPGAIIVPFVIYEDLGFVFQPTKRRLMNDPVPIPLKTGPVKVLLFRVLTSLAFTAFDGIGSQPLLFDLFNVLAFDQSFKSFRKVLFI